MNEKAMTLMKIKDTNLNYCYILHYKTKKNIKKYFRKKVKI